MVSVFPIIKHKSEQMSKSSIIYHLYHIDLNIYIYPLINAHSLMLQPLAQKFGHDEQKSSTNMGRFHCSRPMILISIKLYQKLYKTYIKLH